jgi:hypothetical protein
MIGSPIQTVAVLAGGALRPPVGYAFVIQNNKIVTQSGKPVVIKVY